MHMTETGIPDVKILTTAKHFDPRGFFSETYNRKSLVDAGIVVDFVQDNHVLSPSRGTVRALHFQIPPFAQAKLVRVTRGAIFDVAVDLRVGSSTYGKHVHATISADAWNQILVPIGFAHGYCTLEPNTEVLYKTSNYYSPEHERGILWNDRSLAIPWPIEPNDGATVSSRDAELPTLTESGDYFTL